MWATHTPTHEAKEEKYLELSRKGVLDEVEKLFLAKETKQIGKSVAKKNDKKQIISSDLMKTFQISLAKFSQLSVEEIVRMIIHCDKEVLDNDVVMDFLQKNDLCDISDNTAKVMAPYSKDWTGANAIGSEREQDPTELTREDQLYLFTAFELHHYWKSRMRALSLTRSYEKEYQDISDKLQQIVAVSESLRDSVSLMNVLGLILDIGNYMNDSNKQANGFKLSSLARLGMIKDDKNESTFADLVERIVRTQYPAWESFVDEIGGVITVQKVNVEQLKQDAKKYIDNINNVQMSLDSGNLSDAKRFHPEDRVSHIVQRAMKEARRKAEQMQLYLEDMTKSYDDIMTFYGEDITDEMAKRDFFAKLAAFVNEWKRSREKNIVMEDTRRRNEASMRRKQQATQALTNGSSSSAAAIDSSPVSTGAMDSLLEKLRAAAPQAKDQRDRRRRARLKDRHEIRIASGQTMPEIPDTLAGGAAMRDPESGLLSPTSDTFSDAADLRADAASPPPSAAAASSSSSSMPPRSEDIAGRAASMLQGLRSGDDGSSGGDALEPAASFRRRPRDATAEDERARRRSKRKAGSSAADANAASGLQTPEPPIAEEDENGVATLRRSVGAGLLESDADGNGEGPALATPARASLGVPWPVQSQSQHGPVIPGMFVIPPSPRLGEGDDNDGDDYADAEWRRGKHEPPVESVVVSDQA